MTTNHRRRTLVRRRAATLTAAVLSMGGLTACGDDGAGVDAISGTDLEGIEEQISALDDRIAALEEGFADSGGDGGADADSAGRFDDPAELLNDPESFLDEEVTLRGEVSELWTTTDAGTVFAMTGAGEPVAVVSTTAVEGLDANDEVEVSGTVTRLDPDSFEEDFGMAADKLLDDAEGFLAENEGQVVIDAESVEETGTVE